jgi:hypothetical protein
MFRVAQMTRHGGIDVLIGMDIIGSGDFSVTHHNGNTTFSFCCPSAEIQTSGKVPVRSDKVNRNSPCPCGSGKKYKQCHGR